MRNILIIPLGFQDRGRIGSVETAVRSAFKARTSSASVPVNLEQHHDMSRHQYHSSMILSNVLSAAPAGDSKLLCVVDVDIFIPIFTYIFGEAQLGGRGAIVSAHRLKNEFYGVRADMAIFTERLQKESIHELGHTFGLIHCRGMRCVMNSSTYVEDIDLKPSGFCPACSAQLKSSA
jgi:archaemetzincin